jgi:hypothetical protein
VGTQELLSGCLSTDAEGGGDPRPWRADVCELRDEPALPLGESALLVNERR